MRKLITTGSGIIVPQGLLAERALWKREHLVAVKRPGYERQFRVHAFLPGPQKILLWSGAFETHYEQMLFYDGIGRGIHPFELPTPTPAWNPSLLDIPGLVYAAPTIETFDSTPGGSQWTAPAGVTNIDDYLLVAGGASGGAGSGGFGPGGGGGAGEYIAGLNKAVTPGNNYALTIGPGGTAVTGPGGAGNANPGVNGTDTVFDTLTAKGGGKGGAGSATADKNGGTGGSGGGGGTNSGTAGTGAPNTGSGNNGSAGTTDSGAGGGANAAASGQTPGAGISDSITGSAVTYCKGGLGVLNVSGPINGSAGVNPGDGGDGGGNNGSGGNSGAGRIGRVVLVYTPVSGLHRMFMVFH